MAAAEDFCAICADHLDWTGFGPCGHRDACSRCVARLRFVLKDRRCVICQQDCQRVFFTRNMGDFTARLSPQQFEELEARAARGDVYKLEEVEGFFDDEQQYNTIKKMCSYTHPILSGPGGVPTRTFDSLGALKRQIERMHHKVFCDTCLTGRKVFICEQQLYDRAALDRHNRIGDESGPLAESGFKGHPYCKWCKRHFFESQEMYRHMESEHFHCFICRKQAPAEYVYYRDYPELEDHYRKSHHLCPHPSCLERKFVVFAEEPELKRHFAQQHGGDMTAAQRRAALMIPINLQFADRRVEDRRQGGRQQQQQQQQGEMLPAELAAAAAFAAPGVVIGGGANAPARHMRGRGGAAGGGGGRGMRHSSSDSELAAAMQASLQMAQPQQQQAQGGRRAAAGRSPLPAGADEDNVQPASVTFSAEDFPSVSSSAAAAGAGAGPSRSAGRGGGAGGSNMVMPVGRWAGMAGAGGRTNALDEEAFPALPTMTKAQRRRMREENGGVGRQLLAQLKRQGAPARVLHRGAIPGMGPRSQSANELNGDGSGPSGVAETPAPQQQQQQQHPGAAAAGPAAAPAAAASPVKLKPNAAARPPVAPVAATGDAGPWPGLPGTEPGGARAAVAPPAAAEASWGLAASAGPSSAGGDAPSTSVATPSFDSPNDFPSLRARPSRKQQHPQQQPPQLPADGLSDTLRTANKTLNERIRGLLDPDSFTAFKQQSVRFVQGDISAAKYHEQVLQLRLLPLVADLAALCPNPERRDELMAAHRQWLSGQAAQDPTQLGTGWMPPEAAIAAAEQAAQAASWQCETCTLLNAPRASTCEACGEPKGAKPKPRQQRSQAAVPESTAWVGGGRPAAATVAPAEPGVGRRPSPALPVAGSSADFPELPAAPKPPAPVANGDANGAGPSGSRTGKGKGPVKQSIQQFIQEARRVKPQNAWTQAQRVDNLLQQPEQQAGAGQWKKGGGATLAKKHAALEDAWAKR